MRRLLYRTWIAKKPDALKFCDILFFRTASYPSLNQKELKDTDEALTIPL